MSWHVRSATTDDAQWLVESTGRMAREPLWHTDARLLPEDPNYCGVLWLDAIAHHLVLVVEREGERCGMLLGYLQPHPFNGRPSACTGLWYVAPEQRHTRAGLLLLQAYTDWCRANVDYFVFTMHQPGNAGHDTMRRLGYHDNPERVYGQWGKRADVRAQT